MSEHRFDRVTGCCQGCGILKGCHAEECVAPANLIALQPYLAKRRMEVEAAGHGLDYPPVEKFPPKPPESA